MRKAFDKDYDKDYDKELLPRFDMVRTQIEHSRESGMHERNCEAKTPATLVAGESDWPARDSACTRLLAPNMSASCYGACGAIAGCGHIGAGTERWPTLAHQSHSRAA